MSDEVPKPGRVHFDPTVNLGHILSMVTFLVVATSGYVAMDSRVGALEKEATSLKAKDVEQSKETKEAVVTVENRFMREVTQQRAAMDQTQVRVADDIREIKQLMRDGFRDLDQKLDKKADRPGR
jgi:hypothetical protein